MPPNLKNYTSEVPAITSMGQIERYLVESGATDISKKYENQICTAIRFRMIVQSRPIFFELPANVDACFKVLWEQIKKPIAGTKERTMQQAERTAWKIIKDWVEVQVSMIRLEQVEMLQVFLPFVYDHATDSTYYKKLKQTGFKALLGPAQ